MKKFLTVLLALSVVFTYTVGTAFAAAAPTSTINTIVTKEQTAMKKAAEEYAGKIGYDTKGYMTSVPGATADKVDTNLTKDAVAAGITAFIAHYNTAIKEAGAKAITDGSDEAAAKTAIEGAWRTDFGWTSDDVTYTAATLDGAVFDGAYLTAMYTKAITDAKAVLTAKLNAVDPSAYSEKDAKTVKDAIADAKDAISKITTNDKDGLKAVYTAESAYDTAVKGLVTTTDTQKKLDEYKAEKKAVVTSAADTFKKTMSEELDKVINGSNADKVSAAMLKKNTLDKDVANVLAGFIAKIDVLVIDADDTAKDELKEVTDLIDGVVTAATTAFTYVDTDAAAFYAEVSKVATKEILVDYAEVKAANMKNEYDVTTGLAKYNASTVDEALKEITAAIKAGTTATYADIDTAFGDVKTAADEAKALTALKDDAENAITTDYTKNTPTAIFETGNYESTQWDGERKDAVEAIQKEYVAKIKASKTAKEIEQFVKDARKAMDAYLTTTKAGTVKTTVLANLISLGYVDGASTVGNEVKGSLGGYADVVAAKNPGAFSDATKAKAVVAAADALYEAVLAKNDANLKGSEIDEILKANYNKALAVIDAMKTDDHLKTAEKEINDAIDNLPLVATLDNKASYIAVQAMLENYVAFVGSDLAKITKLETFKSYMTRIVSLEKKAVEDMVKALPKTITVADKEKVDAAKAAYDAYVKAYSKYDATNTNFAYAYAAIDNKGDLDADVKALSDAMMVDAAKKIAALPNIVTNEDKAAVEAARAAYDALNDEEKLAFSEALLKKLEAAEAQFADAKIKATESLKVIASSKLYKGKKIQVKWKVKGDAAQIDGYQVYKSTKANSGYKFMGKTKKLYMDNKKGLKKGTRYYYKVRAYVDVDGTRYYSDWSNKANRIYKK